jgi:hypothetical protein
LGTGKDFHQRCHGGDDAPVAGMILASRVPSSDKSCQRVPQSHAVGVAITLRLLTIGSAP